MLSRLALAALVAAPLVLAGCPDKAKEKVDELDQGRQDLVEEVGGAPKRQIDRTEKRVQRSMNKGLDRLEEAAATE
jgi:outer membrane murein-binding lipoprotein Lpp